MCVTRVATVVSVKGESAVVRFLESSETREVDVSMVETRKGAYVEVFADQALASLTKEEADWKAQLWKELRGLKPVPATR